MIDPPAVTVVVLNYNNYADTRECIASIRRDSYENTDIVLVDNASTDGSGERLRAEFDGIQFHQTETNRGYPGGNNVGIRATLDRDADYIFVLNNDTILPPEADVIATLVEEMESHPNTGVAAPLIWAHPRTDLLWFAKGELQTKRAQTAHVWMGDPVDELDFPRRIHNDWITGCALFVRRSVFEDVGPLDESYFMRLSDVDFTLRVAAAGHDLVTVTDTEIYHKESATTGKYGLTYYTVRNKWRLIRTRPEFHEIATVMYFWWVLKVFRERLFRSPEHASDVLRGLIAGLRGETGERVVK